MLAAWSVDYCYLVLLIIYLGCPSTFPTTGWKRIFQKNAPREERSLVGCEGTRRRMMVQGRRGVEHWEEAHCIRISGDRLSSWGGKDQAPGWWHAFSSRKMRYLPGLLRRAGGWHTEVVVAWWRGRGRNVATELWELKSSWIEHAWRTSRWWMLWTSTNFAWKARKWNGRMKSWTGWLWYGS